MEDPMLSAVETAMGSRWAVSRAKGHPYSRAKNAEQTNYFDAEHAGGMPQPSDKELHTAIAGATGCLVFIKPSNSSNMRRIEVITFSYHKAIYRQAVKEGVAIAAVQLTLFALVFVSGYRLAVFLRGSP